MTPDTPDTWEPLPPLERRVLGVLVEKQKTSKSSETYPLTLNGLTTGCNQKSNRDPVLDVGEDDVEEVLSALQKKGLVTKITGGRAERWKHNLYDAWALSGQGKAMAVLAELLLRGPQTEGDLRGRASRMDDIPDIDQLRAVLQELTRRRLVVYVTAPDRRGAVLTHGFHAADELEAARSRHAGGYVESETLPPRAGGTGGTGESIAAVSARLDDALHLIAKLAARVEALEQKLA